MCEWKVILYYSQFRFSHHKALEKYERLGEIQSYILHTAEKGVHNFLRHIQGP